MKNNKTILIIIAILNTGLIFAQFPQKQVNDAIFGKTEHNVKKENSIEFSNSKADKHLSLVKGTKSVLQIGPAADTLLINSDAIINKDITLTGAGVLIVDNALLKLYGHLDQYDSSKVFIQNGATLHFPQIHNGQYIHRLQDSSYFEAVNSTINTNCVQQIWQYDHSEYISKQTSFTNWNFRKNWNNSILYMEDADMVGDLTVNDSCELTFIRCETILPWLGVDAGDTLDYAFPPWDIVPNYTFSNNLNGVIGIDYTVSFESCTNVLWGVESWQESYIHVDLSVISVAFRLFEDDTIKHIYDYTNHISFEFPFTDRFCKITNSHLYMWFPYVYSDAVVYIDSCRYAESKSYDSSQVYITNSIADGFPSSATAVDNGFMSFSDGLCRTFTTSWFDGTLLLVNTKVEPRPELNAEQNIAHGNSYFLAVNSVFKHDMMPRALDNALVIFASIDSVGICETGANIDITGSAWIDAGPLNLTTFDKYELYFAPAGTFSWTLINTSASQVDSSILTTWNTNGLANGDYELLLTIIDSEGDSLSALRPICLTNSLSIIDETIRDNSFIIYPNPTTGVFTVEGKDVKSIEIMNINGQIIYNRILHQGIEDIVTWKVDLSNQSKGIYFVRIIGNDEFEKTKKIIIQ